MNKDKNGVYSFQWIGKHDGWVDVIKCGGEYYVPYSNSDKTDYLSKKNAEIYRADKGNFPTSKIAF